jgi:hypothetical protein
MNTPWQLQQDQIRTQQAALAHTTRRAAHLSDLRLSTPAGNRRHRTLAAFRDALRRYRTRIPRVGVRALIEDAPEPRQP